MKYRLIVEPQNGSELDGFKRVYYPGVFTSKKKATEFADALTKTGIKVIDIIRK